MRGIFLRKCRKNIGCRYFIASDPFVPTRVVPALLASDLFVSAQVASDRVASDLFVSALLASDRVLPARVAGA